MHLSECFIEVMAYLGYWRRSVATQQPGYLEVKEEIGRLLSESEQHVAAGRVQQEDYHLARFAICAWIDEAILGSDWRHKHRWLDDQLQRLHYQTTDAGEEFFQRLEKISPQQREVREVYYLCLVMGFTGRYCRPCDAPQLDQIKISNLKILLGNPVAVPPLEGTRLFPEPDPVTAAVSVATAQKSSRLVTIACLAAPVLLFCILYLVYRFTLSGISDNFLRMVAS